LTKFNFFLNKKKEKKKKGDSENDDDVQQPQSDPSPFGQTEIPERFASNIFEEIIHGNLRNIHSLKPKSDEGPIIQFTKNFHCGI
jgi:hypothetical protein